MSKKNKVPREHWYSGFTEAITKFVPGTKEYGTMRARDARTGYKFILPFIIGFIVFMLYPLIISLQMSLSTVTLESGKGFTMTWNNFGNYTYAFATDPYFSQYLVDEIGNMAINTICILVMSFVIAVILNQKFKGRLLCRIIFFLPVILASGVLPGLERQSSEVFNVVTGAADEMAAASGVNISASLQDLLSVTGIGSGVFDILFDMIDAIYDIIMGCGIQIIVFLSGLQSISRSLYEAADVEGCTAWEAFWKITFPMVSPLLLVNCIYTIIDFFMKNSNTVMERIHEVTYSQFRFGESSAMSWIYFGVALAFIGISSLIISMAVMHYED